MGSSTQTQYIAKRFGKLLDWIKPSDVDRENFEQYRQTVTRRIKTVFTAPTVKPMGSRTRDSAINGSDLDLLLVLRREDVRWGSEYKASTTVLNEVRTQMSERYVTTDVGRDGQAVVINFEGGKRPVDVVPGFYCRQAENNYPIYCIPNGEGGWMETSPEIHNKLISAADERAGGKLKNVVRLLKFWSGIRTADIPLNSFHIEILLASEEVLGVGTGYAECLRDVFSLLLRRSCRAIQDQEGISGRIKAANTEPKRKTLLQAVEGAAERSRRAIRAESDGDNAEAFRLWDIVFKGAFPRG